MRKNLALVALIAIFLLPINQAEIITDSESETLSLQWNIDFGEVYVSTKPIATNDTIYVRTSSSSSAQGIASIYSITFDGTENWRVENSNSTMSDLAPLVYVGSGQGACGQWPDMVLVGWSDGLLQALDAHNGAVVWQHFTEKHSWGITGSMLIEEETVTLPTRNSIDQLCLNGDLLFSQDIGYGWRNGVTFADGHYWVGDEIGNLWAVNADVAVNYTVGNGKIRHAPLNLMNGDLLIHLQTTSGSTILQFDTEFKAVTAVVESGFSPGKPIVLNDYIITTDSQQVTSLNCEDQCFVVDFESFRSNGEISNVFGNIVLPRNTAEGGYGQFELLPNGELSVIGIASYDDDWYGTAGVESWAMDEQKFILLVNDNANLKLYATNVSSTVDLDINNNQWDTILVLFCALVLISCTSINLLRERFQSAFKFFILFCTILLYFTLGDVIQAWAEIVNEDSQTEDVWDNEWPEEWLGTQVVVFEFTDRTIIAGGLIGHDSVLELTQAGAEQQGLELEIVDSSLGKYLVSIDGSAGEGWEYTVNGQPGVMSAEYSTVESDSVISWMQL